MLQEGVGFQVIDDLLVLGVDPELVKLVSRGLSGVEPDRARLGFAEFGAICFGHQRAGQAKGPVAGGAADQIGAGGDIAPLVRAARL